MNSSTEAVFFSLGPRDSHEPLTRVVEALICATAWRVVLQEGRVIPITSLAQIETEVKEWPRRTSRPWIIAGAVAPPSVAPVYDGPYIKDCRGGGFDEQVGRLMAVFDWAVFSYFTTYQDTLHVFVVRQQLWDSSGLAGLPADNVFGHYSACPLLACTLKNASYYDYGLEGWHAYELARERGEPAPLLLCSIQPGDPALYYRWNSETESTEDFIWYEAPLRKLKPTKAFEVANPFCVRHFSLYEVTDADAYLKIWSMASYDCFIAIATLSADTNVDQLRSVLLGSDGFLNVTNPANECGSWVYSPIYGGGSDEHHALFHARDAALTHRVWELAGVEQISRF